MARHVALDGLSRSLGRGRRRINFEIIHTIAMHALKLAQGGDRVPISTDLLAPQQFIQRADHSHQEGAIRRQKAGALQQ